ncbi:MAG TPA: winged helix-turn-helix domain-containing protein, partial [Firmicutes bacterium]|nr:winged helix-turn-helix domain-containing protein [Bacillota bacterium]
MNIKEAIVAVLSAEKHGMTVKEIYERIAEKGLCRFHAKDPRHTVYITLTRSLHSQGDRPAAVCLEDEQEPGKRSWAKRYRLNLPESVRDKEEPLLDQLLNRIRADYPNGFYFSSTALRLLSSKTGVTVDGALQEALRRRMIPRADGVWLLPDRLAKPENQARLRETAARWIREYGFFQADALLAFAAPELEDVDLGPGGRETFLACLLEQGEETADLRAVTFLYQYRLMLRKETPLAPVLSAFAGGALRDAIAESSGMPTQAALLRRLPLINAPLLKALVRTYLPGILCSESDGVVFFQSEDALGLPADFD